jgi:hypothetical protein
VGSGFHCLRSFSFLFLFFSHHALPRASFHLKTQQEYFFYDKKSFGMLGTGFGGTWFSTLLGNPFADFLREMGQKEVLGQLLLRFAPFLLQWYSLLKSRLFI